MGKVALVTGGTRGIGEAISIKLKANGYNVAANYAGNDEAATNLRPKQVFQFLSGPSLIIMIVQRASRRLKPNLGLLKFL